MSEPRSPESRWRDMVGRSTGAIVAAYSIPPAQFGRLEDLPAYRDRMAFAQSCLPPVPTLEQVEAWSRWVASPWLPAARLAEENHA